MLISRYLLKKKKIYSSHLQIKFFVDLINKVESESSSAVITL